MNVDVLFAGTAVTDFVTAQAWYERFAHDEEVMWQVTGAGCTSFRDRQQAGSSILAMAVPDIEETTAALEARGVATGPIEQEGNAGRKADVGSGRQLNRDH